jgi:hypothetical protein
MLHIFSEFVRRGVISLNRSRLQYMFTGAMASSYYGRPGTTLDIDIVINAGEKDLAKLTKALAEADLRVQTRSLQDAWASDYGIVTIEAKKSPHTLDIIFTDRRLERRAGRILGLPTYFQTPESLILAKLRMLKVTIQAEGTAIDREDIKAILKTTRINLGSLRKKAGAQSTSIILDELIA